MSRPECEHFKGRLRQICRGEARLTLGLINEYRESWGLYPLSGDDVVTARASLSSPVIAEQREHRVDSLSAPHSRGLGDRIAHGIQRATFGLVKPCGGCKQRQAAVNHYFPAKDLPPVEPIALDAPRRHLICHLWPVAGYGLWQWNCERLLERVDLFNGRRIVAVATSAETDSVDAVRDYLRDFTDEFIVVRNHAKLREVVTWIPMLERLEAYQSDQDVTFSCHGKCVRYKIGPDAAGSTIVRWTEAMYQTCLNNWPLIRALLERYGTVGSFRRFMKPTRHGWGAWHYSGTFFWFRNRDAFRRNWRYVPQKFFGTEAWPGLMFTPEEAGVICCDNVGDLYKLDYWIREIEPQLAAWSQIHAAAH